MVQFILLPLLLLVVIPAHVLAQNIDDLAAFDPAAFLLLAATAVVIMLLLVALDRAQGHLPTRRYFSGLVELTFFFVLITGFLLPASASIGMIEAHSVPIDWVHVLMAFVFSYVLALVAASSRRQSLYGIVVAFVAVNMALDSPAIFSLLDRPAAASSGEETGSIFELSSQRNILVMSFDGLPGPAVQDVLKERPDLREKLKDFTFHTGAASTSPATSASIATSLYGNRNYKADYETADELWRFAPEMLITNQLDRADWLVSTYGEYGQLFQRQERAFDALVPRPPPSLLTLLNYSLARSLTRSFVIGGPIGDQLDSLSSHALAGLTGSTFDPAMRFSSHHIPGWKEPLSATGLDFAGYVDKIRVLHSGPVAHFMHFAHTHYPVELDRECRWAGQEKSWYEAHQDYNGEREQVQCALRQMADFVDKLRAIGAYDQSLIILKSDHGEPVSYNDPTTIESFKIRDHPLWGYGRYAPLLAVKDFMVTSAAPSMDEHPVLLDDLAKTLCVRSGIDAECDWYNGFDILGDQWTSIEEAEVSMFIVAAGGESDHRYDTHVPITITRGLEILESLHAALSAEMLQSSVSCAKGLRVESGVPLDNGKSDMQSWLTWHDEGSSFLRVRLDEPCGDARLLLRTEVAGGPARQVQVLVNGDIVDQAPTSTAAGTDTAILDISRAIVGLSGDVVIEVRPIVPAGTNPDRILGVDLN